MNGVGKAKLSWSALAVGVALLVPTDVQAFCQATTTLNDGRCPPQPCPTDGIRLFWGTPQIEYAFHERAFEVTDETTLRAAIRRAFEHWSGVPCDGKPVGFEFADLAEPTPLTVGPQVTEPNLNVVSMLDAASWQALGFDRHVFAKTGLWFDLETGEIVGGDIAFNGSIGTFGVCPDTGCAPNVIDIENVATHEIGHFLGLAHSADTSSTMWCDAVKGDLQKRTLGADDEAGLCAIYGAGFLDPGEPPVMESPQPSASDASSSGCAVGRASTVPVPLLLLMVCLALSKRRKDVDVPRHAQLLRKAADRRARGIMRITRSVAILSICLTSSLTVGCSKNSGRAKDTDSGTDPIGELCTKDPGNERCKGSIQIELNSCPRISVTATPLKVKLGQSASLVLSVIDAEGDAVETEWQADPDGTVDTSQPTASYLCESLGRKTITVYVTDERACESIAMVEFACLDPESFEGSGADPLP